MLNFCDFIQVYVFTTNHHLNIFVNQGIKLLWNTESKSVQATQIISLKS